ncbi:MAG: class I SAM-dependent methyltransferase [Desulfobacterales bacterium]|nr:class I SAM-dependent methyltransferase [Desulfobacterales bacterium]MCF8078168.1 class I SAM-dependent methyltransferase [Desulfobacterales bacterium]
MGAEFFARFFRAFPRLKVFLWQKAYDLLSKASADPDWTFMNYGYAAGAGMPAPSPSDEPNRCGIQLYRHLAGKVDLTGKRVLEIGSGRGGGADYINRCLNPAAVIGLDFSTYAVQFCRKNFDSAGLTFKVGRAEALPFADASFDVVFNVESSHCYEAMAPFLAEVKRVLSPGGYFLFADFRAADEIDDLRRDLSYSGMALIEEADITANVLAALDLDHESKLLEIDRRIAAKIGLAADAPPFSARARLHKFLVKWISEFTGVRDSAIYDQFKYRNSIYISCVLQSPR